MFGGSSSGCSTATSHIIRQDKPRIVKRRLCECLMHDASTHRRIVTFLIIAPYKYSYLLTYLRRTLWISMPICTYSYCYYYGPPVRTDFQPIQEIRSVELGVCPMQLFHFWSRDVHPVLNLLLCTKFHRNRMIFRWDMAIYRFSKWRPSAILELFYHHTRPPTKSLSN